MTNRGWKWLEKLEVDDSQQNAGVALIRDAALKTRRITGDGATRPTLSRQTGPPGD